MATNDRRQDVQHLQRLSCHVSPDEAARYLALGAALGAGFLTFRRLIERIGWRFVTGPKERHQ